MTALAPPPAANAPAAPAKPLVVALVGNPNTGKSTLFNALCGARARTGNFPGVTVEKKIGRATLGKEKSAPAAEVIDLPGTYSLSPRSADEMVSVDVLLGDPAGVGVGTPRPDAVVCVVDASNLHRNLYLLSQVRELGLPVVVALNMTDVARARGLKIDAAGLADRLGVPVVPTEAHRRRGLDDLKEAIREAAARPAPPAARPLPDALYEEADALADWLDDHGCDGVPPYLRERMLLDVGGGVVERYRGRCSGDLPGRLNEARERLAGAGCKVPAVEAAGRYRWAKECLSDTLETPAEPPATASDRLDRVLTHRVWGLLIFAGLMFGLFQAIFSWAGPFMDAIGDGQGWLADQVLAAMNPGALRSLIVDGAIAGVGGVLIFLPQIVILFLAIAVLEDCGYMARAAFLMDRLMSRLGLSGKSFVPLMSSFACAVPGGDGDPRDRESAGPDGHDFSGPADELLGPAAGLFTADRGVRAAGGIPRRVGRTAGAGLVRDQLAGGGRGGAGRLAAAENLVQGRDPAVRHGTAGLPLALPAERGVAGVRPRQGVRHPGRDAHLRHDGLSVGRRLFPR